MKKFNLRFPPPPPPEAPESSSSVSPGAQQYSPSRATSPNSDDDVPPPPTPASLPPRKVLGSDQAKKRLQAFAKMKTTTSPRKSAMKFGDEDHDQGAVKESKFEGGKRYPLVKEATPVMASIMKEETLSRDKVQRNMERKNRDEGVDLRDLLNSRKKKEDLDEPRRSRSRERRRRSSGDSFTLDRRNNSKPSRSSSLDRNRLSLDRSRNIFDDSPGESKRRKRLSGGSSSGRKRTLSGERRRSGSFDNFETKLKKAFRGSKNESSLDGSSEKKRRSSGGSSKHSGLSPLSSSGGRKKMSKEEKWNMPDLMDEMKQKKEARKDIDLWELKHGNKKEKDLDQEEEVEDEKPAAKPFSVKQNTQNGQVLIKANEEEDYFQVKNNDEPRDTSTFIRKSEGLFLEYPAKYMKETSQGISYCFNLEVSQEIHLEEKKNAKIRKSIDSMMFELENETKKKHSIETSKEKPSSASKKKKKLAETKKLKKRKRISTEDDSSQSQSQEKKKKMKTKKGKVVVKKKKVVEENSVKETLSEKLSSTSVPTLSAAGMSKLYSMAGYTDNSVAAAATEQKKDSQEKPPKTKGEMIQFSNSLLTILYCLWLQVKSLR